MDEILDVIVERSLPKSGKISRGTHERMSIEDLWSTTIWGKVVTNIRDEILYNNGGVEADTKLQRRFRNRFRVPLFLNVWNYGYWV